MESNTREAMFNDVCRILATEESQRVIAMTFERVGTELGLDGIFFLSTGDIPLFLEMRDLWEVEPIIGDRRPIFDLNNDAEDWPYINPYIEESRFVAVDDVSNMVLTATVAELAASLGIKSFALSSMVRLSDFLGTLVFYHREPHKWTEDERGVIKEFTDLLYVSLLRRWKGEMQRYLLQESNMLVQKAFDSRSQFLTAISHDVRTPINALIGMTSILHHNSESREVLEQCIDRIEKSSKQLMDLVNDCAQRSLTTDDGLLLNKTWLSLDELCQDLRRVTEHFAAMKELNIEYRYDSSIRINVDRSKLERVLTNLISNACQYSRNGGEVLVVISPEETGGGQTLINFRIKDNGDGIDASVARHLFDQGQTDGLVNRSSKTGLGLMVTKHIVDLMHGTIELSSGLGHGTEVLVGIHCETDGNISCGKIVDPSDEPDNNAEMYIGRKILIAEDNVLMAEILATILGYRGLETDTVINGKEAFDTYMNNDAFYYDMILMDIQMPVMDGLKATEAIRTAGKADSAIIPIIALTSNNFEEDVKESLAAGMNAHLIKPVAEKELFDTIREYML